MERFVENVNNDELFWCLFWAPATQTSMLDVKHHHSLIDSDIILCTGLSAELVPPAVFLHPPVV